MEEEAEEMWLERLDILNSQWIRTTRALEEALAIIIRLWVGGARILYDQYDNEITNSTKSSMVSQQPSNTNYRKAFNPAT
jgi:hypothetical protein